MRTDDDTGGNDHEQETNKTRNKNGTNNKTKK